MAKHNPRNRNLFRRGVGKTWYYKKVDGDKITKISLKTCDDDLARARRDVYEDAKGGEMPELPPELPTFAEAAERYLEEAQAEHAKQKSPGVIRRNFAALSPLARALLIGAGLLVALTLGVQWEAGGEMTFGMRLLANAWMAAAFAASIATLRRVNERFDSPILAWGLGLSLLLALGTLTDLVV